MKALNLRQEMIEFNIGLKYLNRGAKKLGYCILRMAHRIVKNTLIVVFVKPKLVKQIEPGRFENVHENYSIALEYKI